MKTNLFLRITPIFIFFLFSFLAQAQSSITGKILDKKSKEPLVGATVLIENTKMGTTTNIDGNFQIKNLSPGEYTLKISYVSYQTQELNKIKVKNGIPTVLTIEMEEAELVLQSVQVVAQPRTDTELSLLREVKSSLQITNGISSQQISKTLDTDASEVIKRVPGITIQENRFVVVRGLNQRYNNVWLNNAPTPSSEIDVKAFSFDNVPSNMIDHIITYKSASPELPAEATGAFIKIFTKNIPEGNFLNIEYSVGYNNQSTFKNIYHLPSKPLDIIGLGSHARELPANFPSDLNLLPVTEQDAYALQLNRNWVAQSYKAFPAQKFQFSIGKKWNLNHGTKIGNITSLSYNASNQVRDNMTNNMYEQFDAMNEVPIYLYRYTADIYATNFRWGLMHNWGYQTTTGTRIEFKNLLNQIGEDKTSNTFGWNNYRQGNFKYFSNQYSSRTIYSGQLSGNHQLQNSDQKKLDWNVDFSYANRLEPDRQNWSMKEAIEGTYIYVLPDVPSINELGRLFTTTHEYLSGANINFENTIKIGKILPTYKVGALTEYKTRNFSERSIAYRKEYGPFSDEQINSISFEDLFTAPYLGHGKVISVDEQTNVANTYKAKNLLAAGYFSITIPVEKFILSGGVRAEYNRLLLNGYYDASSPVTVKNPAFRFFPSLNTSFNFTNKSLLRLAYAYTINRPEFREISPFCYYDFTEKTSVRGNPDLKDATIHNVDLRFENYPSPNETFTLALFYKNFIHPIEMVNIGVGNEFSFKNAQSAVDYGIELELKKSLEKWLKNFSLNLNASYIFSQVHFSDKQNERNRPLQGQSPYVVNAALFYQNDKAGINSSLVYNLIGKRILVAAQINQGEVVIPDIYEMPRNVLDFSFNKKIGQKVELKFGIKDLLAQNFRSQQTYEYTKNGKKKSSVLNNQIYNLGTIFLLGINLKF